MWNQNAMAKDEVPKKKQRKRQVESVNQGGGLLLVAPVRAKGAKQQQRVVPAVVSQPSTAGSWRMVSPMRPTKPPVVLSTGDMILSFDVGQTDMAECVLEVDYSRRPPFQVIEWNILNLGSGTVSDSVAVLFKMIQDRKRYWGDMAFTVIEQQDNVNTKMVAISHALESMIMMKGCPRVMFASSSQKFGPFLHMPGSMVMVHQEPKEMGSAYACKKVRKNNALVLVREMLHALPVAEGLPRLNQLKATIASQKDDLADAFIYGSAFIYRHEPVSL